MTTGPLPVVPNPDTDPDGFADWRHTYQLPEWNRINGPDHPDGMSPCPVCDGLVGDH